MDGVARSVGDQQRRKGDEGFTVRRHRPATIVVTVTVVALVAVGVAGYRRRDLRA